jgi:hypothetical protein
VWRTVSGSRLPTLAPTDSRPLFRVWLVERWKVSGGKLSIGPSGGAVTSEECAIVLNHNVTSQAIRRSQ